MSATDEERRRGKAAEALRRLREIMGKLKWGTGHRGRASSAWSRTSSRPSGPFALPSGRSDDHPKIAL
jgi:hypothetical protein